MFLVIIIYISVFNVIVTRKVNNKKWILQIIRDVFIKNIPKTSKLLYPQPNFDAKKQEKRHFSLIIVRF